jgi:membrane associated rhomboid family serine protease
MASISDYFQRHEEQAFIAKALVTAVLIILIKEFLSGIIQLLLLFFPIIFLVFIRMQAAVEGTSTWQLLKKHITFLPIMYAEGERKREVVPWATYGIILLDVVIFYCYEPLAGGETLGNLVFLPVEPNLWNVPLSAFTSMFLHGSGGHLWGNMVFLWVLGTVVERRVGHRCFLLLYLITGLAGNFTFALMELIFNNRIGHVLGASGAIAGIMGVFAVRCYFMSMVFPLPILGVFSLILPISLKIRLNSLVIIGLFFLMDLSGGIGQIAGQANSMVGHWAHLGGVISGMLLAGLFLKLGDSAIEERHLEIGVKASQAAVGYEGGERSLKIALERNPDNGEAILAMARLKTKFTPTVEGKELYEQAMELLIYARPQEAVEVFREFYRKYLMGVEPRLMFRLAAAMEKGLDMELAARAYEFVLKEPEAPPELRGRAMFQAAALLDTLGYGEDSAALYRRYLEEFPDGPAAPKVRMKLGLPSAHPTPSETVNPPPSPVADAGVARPGNSCPSCSNTMIRRRATNGPHAGRIFWVCADYPRCRGVIPAES